jgi:spermidine/putrescine transport system permease protein
MERQRPRAPRICTAILVFALGLLYLPIIYLIAGSFIDKTSGVFELSLRWYSDILSDQVMIEALGRSLTLAFTSALISTSLGTAASLALFRSGFRGRMLLENLSMLSLVMPELVFALALLSWFFVLKFKLSLITVVIAHVSFTISFVILTVRGRLATLDESLNDAARDLGASEWTLLRKVTLPILKPALLTAFLLCFLLSFDDFLITFFTSGVGSDTLPIKLYASMKLGHSPKLNALSSLMIFISIGLIVLVVRSKSFADIWGSEIEKKSAN